MKFSIIIPLYNVEQYIKNCVESIANQTFADYEVVFIDDGCTDETINIIKNCNFIKRIPEYVILQQQNSGTAVARNNGISYARGEYILFLDSDDWLEENTLEVINENLNGEDFLCFSGRRYFEALDCYEESDVLPKETHITGWDYYSKHALAKRNFAFVCVVLRAYKKTFLIENTLLFEPGIYHEDNLWVPITCYHAHDISIIPNSLYVYRIREGSKQTTNSIKQKKDIIVIANKLASFFIPKTDLQKRSIYQAITHHFQVAFNKNTHSVDKELLSLVDWNAYKTVSRTKFRHRIQYCAMRISPSLFRFINSL